MMLSFEWQCVQVASQFQVYQLCVHPAVCVCLVPSAGQSGKTILSNFNDLLAASAADRAVQGDFPFSVTEHNARTSSSYSSTTANLDDAAEAVKLASQSINLATAGDKLTSLYAFKFSVTLSGSNGVAKNGIHW